MNKLEEHARLTVALLTRFGKNRNYRGLKQWERKLLKSAYDALNLPISPEWKERLE